MKAEEIKKIRKRELKPETKELIAKYSSVPLELEGGKWDVQRADGSGHLFEKQSIADIYGLLLAVLEKLDRIGDKIKEKEGEGTQETSPAKAKQASDK